MTETVGHFGLPPDGVAVFAGVLGILIWALRRQADRRLRQLDEVMSKQGVRGLALIAAAASLGYYTFYLRGGPRIIDSTYYWLQANTFASGHLTLPLLHPTASLRGRFLFFDSAHSRLSVLFPPGYALILALGMLVKSPQFVGPCIASLLVLVTAALARRVFDDSRIALTAAVLSTICVALRYHTADTMSHGWAALLFTISLWAALGTTWRDWVISGLSAGWLLATRPASALALLVIVAFVLRRSLRRSSLPFALAMLPGVAVWLIYQRVSTGNWLHSTQLAYYAVSDGPPGCFRYGFGSGIGCHFEHGGYVEKRLPNGYNALAALVVTGVRLRWHLLDVLNFEPLALLLLVAAKDAFKVVRARPLIWVPVILVIAYAPFYFDGNYPGGGARLLADALPVEHVLLASWLSNRSRLIPALSLSLLGFSFHGSFEHHSLQNRDGGRPMFEEAVIRDAGIHRGLILVDTDHGFALGHQPAAVDARRGIVVARERRDAHDRVLWEQLGSPPVYRYRYPFVRGARATLEPLTIPTPSRWRFEAEAEWPVLSARDAWATPGFPPVGCVSDRRALVIHPSGSAPEIEISLPIPRTGRYRVSVGWVAYESGLVTIGAKIGQNSWKLRANPARFECGSGFGPPIVLSQGEYPLKLEFSRTLIAIDWVELEQADLLVAPEAKLGLRRLVR